jgi:D-glycero-alpha-D-manno-heptose-7-phosphate kinase
MVLYFTGRSRSSAQIIDEQKKNTETGNAQSVEAMHRIKQGAVDMKLAVLKGDMKSFSKVLGQNWEDKKKMANAITNPVIEEAFDIALAAGAKSGKVSGAGGGGFIMFFVEPTSKRKVIEALKKLDGFIMPFNFTEGGAHGWKIYDTDNVSSLKY